MKPNIVFILVDDMGYGDFGRFNDGLTRTPAIDALCDQSVCLTQSYTGSPVCNPSRAALLTGRYPHRTGSIDTLEWRGLERLALREVTLADRLRAEGYRTGLIGKWHLGAFDERYHPRKRGFDETVCFRGGMHDYWDWRIEWDAQPRKADGRYLTDVWTEEACGFIERNAGGEEPFFLHLTYNAPHTPLQVPEAERQPWADRDDLTEGVKTLYGMIARMDAGVGRVIETLDRCGVRDNTILVFTSDNGPQFGGQGEKRLNRFNCHWNGAKGSTYEGGIRVPLLIRWPDGLPGGTTCDRMVHFTDWVPTLLSLANIDRPTDGPAIDGIDVSANLRGEDGEVCTHRYWQWNRYSPVIASNAAVRDGDWKLVRPAIAETMAVPDIANLDISMYHPEHFIEHGVLGGEPPREVPAPPPAELYNLAEDPGERNNLAETHPQKARALLADLETWFQRVEADRQSITDTW